MREGFDASAARAYKRAAGGRYQRGVRFEDVVGGQGGLGDLFSDLFGRGRRVATQGSDVASEVTVDFMTAIAGSSVKLRVQDRGDEVTVRIPPGAADGDRVRVKGHGAPGMFVGAGGGI